jgi:Zn-dependent peptidase ImmA (M78 family)
MKIPDKLKIGAMDWKVEYSELLGESVNAFGQCIGNKQIILIEKGLTPSNEARTFLHELLHAIFWTSNACSFLPSADAKKLEEDLVSTLDSALLSAIRDNDLDFRND